MFNQTNLVNDFTTTNLVQLFKCNYMRFSHTIIGISLFIVAVFASCATQQQQKNEQPAPAWVQQKPIVPGHYVGIGSIEKVGLPTDYIPKAQNRALNDMASSISSMVSSSSVLFKIENQYGATEGYSQHINVETNEYIEGFEPTEAYETADRYWVMYTIDKNTYQQKKQERKAKAIQAATDKYNETFKLEQTSDVISALKGYIQALTMLKNHLGESNMTSIDGQEIELGGFLLSKIEKLRSQITIQASEEDIVTKRHEISNIAPTFTVYFENMPLAGAPLKFRYSGGYLVRDKAVANGQGVVQVQISNSAASTTQNYLVASLNWEEIVKIATTDQAMRRLLEPISMPEKTIAITTTAPTVGLRMQPNELVTNAEMHQRFEEIVNKSALTLEPNANKADYVVEIDFKVEPGESAGGLTSYYCSGAHKISDNSGKVIKQATGQKTRGVSENAETAKRQSVNNYINSLFQLQIPSLLNAVD